MARIHVVVEGPTEEAFVKTVLYPPLSQAGLFPNAILAPNKKNATARVHRGGGRSFGPALHAIRRKLQEDTGAYCTTLFDYYALPDDFPGHTDDELPPPAHLQDRIDYLENALDVATGSTGRLIPYLQLHEYEAILFSDVTTTDSTLMALSTGYSRVSQLQSIVDQAGSPEAINDGPTTAPSKRLLDLYPTYDKVFFGPLIAGATGLAKIRTACPRFHTWMCRLEALAPQSVTSASGTPNC